MMVSKNSLTLEIVFNDSVSDVFLWILATPPRPPAGGPRGSIFLTFNYFDLLFVLILIIVIVVVVIDYKFVIVYN